MPKRKLKQIEFNITNGSPQTRLRKAEEALPMLQQEMVRLDDKAQTLREEHKGSLEAWTSRPINGSPRPVARQEDMREIRLADAGALVLTVTELALAFFIAIVFMVNPILLLLLAIVAIFALKAGLLTILRNDDQPQETRRLLRQWVIKPSLAITMLAIAVLVFARINGELALLLLPLINLALCFLSLGCLGLAAGFFALAYLLRWSRHAERHYNAVEREAMETLRVLRRAEQMLAELKSASSPNPDLTTSDPPVALQRQPVGSSASGAGWGKVVRRGGSFLTLLLLVALGGGCTLSDKLVPTPATQGAATSPSTPQPSLPASPPSPQSGQTRSKQDVLMEIWLDWSLSASANAYRESAEALINALPELAAQYQVVHLTAHQFSDDGWNAPEILSLDLPAADNGKADEAVALFGNVRKEQEQRAARQHVELLRGKLRNLRPEALLPNQPMEPRCTDICGVLRRLAEDSRAQRKLVFLLTDGHNTCAKQLQQVSLTRTAMVVVLMTEEGRANSRRPSNEGWERRRNELAQAVPTVVIVPHFGDLPSAADQAMAKLTSQPNK